MGSSFASCFGAGAPISPRRMGGRGLLGGQVYVNYHRLGLDELDENDYTCTYEKPAQEDEGEEEAKAVCESVEQRRERSLLQSRRQSLSSEQGGRHYASEGEEYHRRESETENVKLGKQRSKREKAEMQTYPASETPSKVEEPSASEEAGEGCVRERKGTRKLAKLWSKGRKNIIYAADTAEKQEERHHGTGEEEAEGEAAGYCAKERNGPLNLVKLCSMRRASASTASAEKIDEYGRQQFEDLRHLRGGEKEEGAMTPRRESLSRKVKEACLQVLESARRSSPHLSELFVGNQLLMQVTSTAFVARRSTRDVQPSTGFPVAGDSAVSTVSPPCSSSSSTL